MQVNGQLTGQMNGEQCSVEDEPKVESWNGFLTTLLVAVLLTLVVLCGALWRIIRKIKKDIRSIEHQLCDHYEYASEYQKRLDGLDARCEINEGGVEALDESTECIRYGLMQQGGFVNYRGLTISERAYMVEQEQTNLVLWRARQRNPENTDGLRHDGDQAEILGQPAEASDTPKAIRTLTAMRADQNMALQTEDWEYAAEIQTAINVVLNEIHKTFQRLYRRARNDGRHSHAMRYKRYVEDMAAAIGN